MVFMVFQQNAGISLENGYRKFLIWKKNGRVNSKAFSGNMAMNQK